MIGDTIERDFHEKVSAQIRLRPDGLNRFRVLTPFLFEDGDHLATFMHLTYSIDENLRRTGVR